MAICTITGYITKLDGSPSPGQQVVARIESTDDDQGGQLVDSKGVVSDYVEAYSGDDGSFSIDVLQGATIVFEIPMINLSKRIVVPAESTAEFGDLI